MLKLAKSAHRSIAVAAILLAALPAAFAAPRPAQPASAGNNVVIVFKDGHRQTISLGDIERLEFSGPVPVGLISIPGPSREHFFGQWQVGDGNGSNFIITLRDDGTALRSIGHEHGTWEYVNGEAQVTWDDGWQDCIRKVGSWYKKYAYSQGKTFASDPDNVANARNVTQNPRGVD
ncbi:MAG TPA: hypothetical protein VHX60_17350 [Acidobacteriaceae bacterium]|jgi:hypothetical protein|nr:hypothetical protein [Acidobacteriaceae bacterium]